MVWLKISFLLFLAHIAHSDKFCKSETPCKCVFNSSTVIDLTSAGNHKFPLFYEVSIGNHNCSYTELYSYNPCFPFDIFREDVTVKPPHKACLGAAACVKVPAGSEGGLSEEHAIGLQQDASFGIDGKNVYIQYTVPGTETKLKVYLTCSKENDSLTVINPECLGGEVVLNFTSKCACPNGCPSTTPPADPSPGMSTGSKLLIAFFTIVFAYLIVGILWNFCNGAQGPELVPNLAFWTDLPTLMMEGVTFTCSCCSKKSTYGEV